MNNNDVVSFPHPKRQKYADARKLTRDFCSGTTDVHNNAEIYTPREGHLTLTSLMEDLRVWEIRSKWTEVYGAARAAKDASVGLILSQPPTLGTSTPDLITKFSEDVDGKGNHLMVFCRELLDSVLTDGVQAILVDLPEWPVGLERNEENRINSRIRPVWSRYDADSVINWDGQWIGGEWMLTLLVFKECSTERVGQYRMDEVTRYREIRLDPFSGVVSWMLWKDINETKDAGNEKLELEREGTIEAQVGVPLGYIPAAILYGQKPTECMVCEPPLAPIAELNLGYYRTASDRRWSMHLHFSPTMVIKGREPKADGTFAPVRLGVGAVIDVPATGDAAYLNAGGEAFEPSEKELTRIAMEMGSLSLAFLARDNQASGVETATARRLEAQSGKASLSMLAQNLQDTLERLFNFTQDFLGIADMSGTGDVDVRVKLTYDLEEMNAQTLMALNAIAQANNLSTETFLSIMKSGRVLPDDIDLNEEMQRIADQRMEAQQREQDLMRSRQPFGAEA